MFLSLKVLDNPTSDNILYHHTVDFFFFFFFGVLFCFVLFYFSLVFFFFFFKFYFNRFTSLACISDKIHTQKSILQTACNEQQVIRECEKLILKRMIKNISLGGDHLAGLR